MNVSDKKLCDSLYEFLLNCGNEHDPYAFCGAIAKGLHHFIPYDQARVIFLGKDGRIVSSLLYGVSQKTWNTFMDFYLDDCIGSTYSLKHPLHLSEDEKVNVCDWTDKKQKDGHKIFESYYVRSLKLTYCLGIGLSDINNSIRCIFSLDRTTDQRFTREELALVRKLRPLLDNYFINMMRDSSLNINQQDFVLSQSKLTEREKEIARLMYRGLTPADIGNTLCISINTAYKHIANMYKKLGVSSRQEFFCLMSRGKGIWPANGE
ncbi:MAG: helix-turn-helix transcriptional regulator [Fusicatenibacter sp.]|nr:helix-turn-helix transcriptional regulator [Lachnospiraceae bacterium]MDY2939103.1 helix-turn-helix transcriptional regulator [Fusicatenibacter sp.]